MALPIPKYLKDIYSEIIKLNFVVNKEASPTQAELNKFAELLNESVPQTETDHAVSQVVRVMFSRAAHPSYTLWTRNIKMPQAILWSACIGALIRLFNLRGRVYLRFNNTTKKYEAELYKARTTEEHAEGESWNHTRNGRTYSEVVVV